MTVRYNVQAASGNANTITAGNSVNGNTVMMGNNARKLVALSALASFTAATSTLTATGQWQVSGDNSTWTNVTGANNAANVVFTTGTAAIKTAVFDAPACVYGARYARFVFTIGVATGNTGDLYSIAYNYRTLAAGDGQL